MHAWQAYRKMYDWKTGLMKCDRCGGDIGFVNEERCVDLWRFNDAELLCIPCKVKMLNER